MFAVAPMTFPIFGLVPNHRASVLVYGDELQYGVRALVGIARRYKRSRWIKCSGLI
jgi:hypothetical protein